MSDLENLPSDIEEEASKAVSSLLPEKSRERYESVYNKYENWCQQKGTDNLINEKVLLAYFSHLSEENKPTSLWAFYSMIRSVISLKRNTDISKYANLIAFLKKKSEGFQPKKSKMLSKSDVTKFLLEASDEKFLFMKVALIVGLAGACRKQELTELNVNNVKDRGEYYHFIVSGAKTKGLRQFIVTAGDIDGINLVNVIRKYASLRPKNATHGRFFIQYKDKKCTKQPVGINTFAALPKNIALFLKLETPEKYTGLCMIRSCKSLFADSDTDKLAIKHNANWKLNMNIEEFIENSIKNEMKITTKTLGGYQIQTDYMEVPSKPTLRLEGDPVNIEVKMDHPTDSENPRLAFFRDSATTNFTTSGIYFGNCKNCTFNIYSK